MLTLAQRITLSNRDRRFGRFNCRRRYVTMRSILSILMHHKMNWRSYPESNQISISDNRTPVREIDAQTEKITELPPHGNTPWTTYMPIYLPTFIYIYIYIYIYTCLLLLISMLWRRQAFSNRTETGCLALLNAGSLEPKLQQTECPLTNRLSYRGSSYTH